MEGEKLICDCPNHQDKRFYGFWPTSGEVDIPKCASRCPYCSLQSATKRFRATAIRAHIKRAHLSEDGTGTRLPNLTLILRRPGPYIGTAYGRSIESSNAFTPPAYIEEPSQNQTKPDPVSGSSDTTKSYETQEPKTEHRDGSLYNDPVWNELSQRGL